MFIIKQIVNNFIKVLLRLVYIKFWKILGSKELLSYYKSINKS